MKNAPFTKCNKCRFDGGNSYEEKAKSFMLSEEYLREKKQVSKLTVLLREYAKQIQANETIGFAPEEVIRLADEQRLLEDIPPFQALKIAFVCLAFFAIPIVALIVWLFL